MSESIIALLDANAFIAVFAAFFAGTLTAAAPCSLVSVPLLVGSAVAFNKDLEGRKKVVFTYLFAALFALGVVLSFSFLAYIVAKYDAFFSIAPSWAYAIAAVLSILIGLYAWGVIGSFDKSAIINKLIRFRLWGAVVIGIIFGLVSTPCASAPLVAIIGVAANSGPFYAYILILSFALGHSLLLLAAGVSVGFAQSIVSNRHMAKLSLMVNRLFALLLIGMGLYFIYQMILQM